VRDIYLWWIGADAADGRVLNAVRSVIERTFGRSVHVWSGRDRPAEAFDARRQQHSSTRILQWLVERRPDEAHKVLALTDVDLFIPILTFVFGEAQLNGRAAVVSTARLGEPGLPDPRVVLERLAKESVHEIGHCFGLVHCDVPGCVMGRSSNARDVDRKRGEFCTTCRGRVVGRGGEGQ
jgi:archaemetzincin